MGYVMKTTTECAGEAYRSESLHFETYEDFIKYRAAFDDKVEGHSVTLTDQQIYKLRIILGHVLGDKDCYELNEQLDSLCGSELVCEDYDKLFFTFIRGNERVVLEDGEKSSNNSI